MLVHAVHNVSSEIQIAKSKYSQDLNKKGRPDVCILM